MLDGLIFIKDNDYKRYLSIFTNESFQEIYPSIQQISISNNITLTQNHDLYPERRNYTVLIFPLSKINESLWNTENESEIFKVLNQGIWDSHYSTLCLPEQKLKELINSNYFSESGIKIILDIQFSKEILVDKLFNSTTFSSELDFILEEIERVFRKFDFIEFYSDNGVKELERLSNQMQAFFLLIQFLIELPLFLFIGTSFKLLHSVKNYNYKENLLNKLYLKGYSKFFHFSYSILEFIILLLITFLTASIFSVLITAFVFITLDWQEFWSHDFSMLGKVFFQVTFNVESKIAITIVLFLADFHIWKNILLYTPMAKRTLELPKTASILDFNLISKFFKITVILISLIIIILTLFVLNFNNQIYFDQSGLVLIFLFQGIAIFLLVFIFFIDGGLYIAKKLCAYLSYSYHVFGEVRYFLISKKNQKLFITAQLFVLIALFSLSTSYHTFIFNGRREAEFISGADVIIKSNLSLNRSYTNVLANNVTGVELISVLNKTESSLGSEFSALENIYSIAIIDPVTFFEVGYFENGFFTQSSVDEIQKDLQENGSILISYHDKPKLKDQITANSLKILGYSNATKSEKYEWIFEIIDYYKFWPNVETNYLKDNTIQLIMNPITFQTISTRINISSQAEYWIKLKSDFSPSSDKIDFLLPSHEYSISKRQSEHPILKGIAEIFVTATAVSIVYILILTFQIYIVFMFYDFSTKKHEIGVFRSMGVSIKQSILGQTLHFSILGLLVILPFLTCVIVLIITFSSFLSFLFSLPLIIVIDTNSIILILIGLLTSISAIPLMSRFIIKKPIALLIKSYE